MNRQNRRYFVYMLANGRMIYTGVTGDLHRRVWELKNGLGSDVTRKYTTHQLVWFDETDDRLTLKMNSG